MINQIIFDDEITLWWQESDFSAAGARYELYLDGKLHGTTDKTHYSFLGLCAQSEYQIKMKAFLKEEAWYEKELTASTAKAKKAIDVTKPPYNAIGDGTTLNTKALQTAINDCGEGERVYLPAGVYKTGALTLHSDMELYLCEGAVLQGSDEVEDYLPKIKSRFEGLELLCYQSLLNIGEMDHTAGYTSKNVVIRGKGSIYGGGATLCDRIMEVEGERLEKELKERLPNEEERKIEIAHYAPRARGRLINSNNTENLIIAGLALGFAASWNLHFVYSKDIVTYGCSISSKGVRNGDGWDPDSSENCVLFDTVFDTHDNAVAIKSGKNPEGNIVNRPTKNVMIFDCRGTNDLAVGSEISGGIDGVYIWDCFFLNSWGINIKTTPERGAYMRNIRVTNSELATVTVRTRLPYNNDGEGAGELTVVENLHFENLILHGLWKEDARRGTKKLLPPIFAEGFDEEAFKIRGMTLRNIRILPTGAQELQSIVCKNVKGLTLENIDFE